MSFTTIDTAETASIFNHAGEDATYDDGGTPFSIKVLIDHDVTPFDGPFSTSNESRTEIEFQAADVSSPKRGDTVTHNLTVYELQDQVSSDGIIHRFTAK